MNASHHEMIFEQAHASGVEEWYCPNCGRRFLVQWAPAYRMVILEPGDKDTRHNLSRSSLPRPLPVSQTEASELTEDFRLIPWLKWMQETDFDSRWDRNA